MQAIKLYQPSSSEALTPVVVSKPVLKPGYVIIQVKAVGINESEVTSRRGESDGDFSYPRILGIEAAGIIETVNTDSPFKSGQKVITMMGGMGRSIDGGYAEYVMVKEANVIPFEADIPWEQVGRYQKCCKRPMVR